MTCRPLRRRSRDEAQPRHMIVMKRASPTGSRLVRELWPVTYSIRGATINVTGRNIGDIFLVFFFANSEKESQEELTLTLVPLTQVMPNLGLYVGCTIIPSQN